MPKKFSVFFLFSAASLLFFSWGSSGQINSSEYGLVQLPSSKIIAAKTQHSMDSMLNLVFFFQQKEPESFHGAAINRIAPNRTLDFYFLLGLILFLGLIRVIDPKYMNGVRTAYFNTGFAGRSLKDKLEQSLLPNLLMHLFFAASFGVYVFYIWRSITSREQLRSLTPFLIGALIVGILLVYLVKYAVIRFSGWAFDIASVTDTYLFNVFLVNKILAIGLLPFIAVMAFQSVAWSSVAVVLSLILVLAMLISRYVKSWQVLGSFFQYSKFHFFTYLCASEIMPLAVLTKCLLSDSLWF